MLFTSAFISVSTKSERLVPDSSASTLTFRWSASGIITVTGFLSGAVVGEGVGFVKAAGSWDCSSPLLLVLVVVDLGVVVVVVMPAIRASPTAINLPGER